MKPGTSLQCRTTGRLLTVRKKRKHKSYNPAGVKVVHLKAEHLEMSIRADLIDEYFKVVQ